MNTTTFSRKTIAIALAAGMTLGAVTVPQFAGVQGMTAVAGAAELDPSVVTKTELVSDKSGKNVLGTTVEATKEAYDNFFNTHGEDYKLKLDFEIPDSAQPGDTFTINAGRGDFKLRGSIKAPTEDGRKVGQLNVQDTVVTFTVSEQVAGAQNRKASFEVPLHIRKNTNVNTGTRDESLDGTPAKSDVYGFSSANEKLVFEKVYQYRKPPTKPTLPTDPIINDSDEPITGGFEDVNLDIGQAVFLDNYHMHFGHANASLESSGTNTDSNATYDDVYKLDETAQNNRDVTIRYAIDDPQGQIIPTPNRTHMQVFEFSPTGLSSKDGDDPAYPDARPFFYKEVDKTFNVTYKRINAQTIDVVFHDVPPNYAVNTALLVRAESPYSPGKKVTITKTFVNGVGEPHSAYDQNYTKTLSNTYTHPSFAGYGSADDIKRNVTMSAKVNGNDANSKSTAEQVEGGKAKFTIDLANKGNIGASSATVKYPKGVTGPNGETEKFIDFGKDGFPANSTKTLDLGELNVPEGASENKFTVIMTGYPELTDPAWTSTGPTDIYVSDVKKVGDKYEITRNDGKKWTIDLADLNKRISDLENKDTVSPEDLNKVKEDLKNLKDGIDGLKGKDAEINKELDKLRNDLNDLKPRVDKLEERVTKLEGLVIKEVKDNGDGTYTLIREDGSKVKGNIDVGDNITKIVDNGDGSITITRGDGSTEKVNLSQTVVTETNKGKPNHTITITTPDGKKVTFNAFDVYVTDVKKNAKGDYDIYRSDVNDGKTVWKTIVLSDIRGKITKLEGDLTKLTEKQAADVKDIKDQIAGLEKEIESLQGAQDDLDKRVTTLETKVAALTLRVTNLEKRVKGLEETDAAWAKCYAGIGATGVPMLLALPLALMSDLNIPGLNQLNTQIQRTIGIYNPEAAKWMAQNRGLFSAATGVLTAAGVLGMLIHTAKECQPYTKTPGMQDNMNPIIEGSSKIAEKIESGSSKAGDKDKGSSVDAGSSTGDGSSTDAGSSTAEGSATTE